MSRSYSRRQTLHLAGLFGTVGAAAACSSTATRAIAVPVGVPPAYITADFTRTADGPLPPIGGRPWYLSASRENPVVLRGAMGPPAGHVPGSVPGGTTAGYSQLELPGPCRRIGGILRWDATSVGDSSVCLGAFTTIGFNPQTSSSPIHLSVTPKGCEFAVFARRYDDFTSLAPEGGLASFVAFDEPLACDGTSLYRCECVVDPATCTAYVTIADRFAGTYRDPRIGSINASYPFWEYFTMAGNANIGRFTALWTDVR